TKLIGRSLPTHDAQAVWLRDPATGSRSPTVICFRPNNPGGRRKRGPIQARLVRGGCPNPGRRDRDRRPKNDRPANDPPSAAWVGATVDRTSGRRSSSPDAEEDLDGNLY